MNIRIIAGLETSSHQLPSRKYFNEKPPLYTIGQIKYTARAGKDTKNLGVAIVISQIYPSNMLLQS